MRDVLVFEHKKFSQLNGRLQNEIIEKVRRATTFRYSSVEEALQTKDPHVLHCHEYPELTRIQWYDTTTLFTEMQKIEGEAVKLDQKKEPD